MIYVITHKKFDDENFIRDGYKVLHVGENKDCKDYYLRDDVKDNISYKNANYCELTGMYWLWKNADETENDMIGLIHYRRGFTTKKENKIYISSGAIPHNLSFKDIKAILEKYDIIVPVSEKSFKTVKKSYEKLHCGEDLKLVRDSIACICPEYLKDFDKAMRSHHYYNGNMILCKKKVFDQYASWLFSIYEKLDSLIDVSKYNNNYQARVFGFLSERLLNVWLMHNNLKCKEMPIFNTEIRTIGKINKNIKRIKKLIGIR